MVEEDPDADWNRQSDGTFGPGNKGGPGRPKGSVSLVTAIKRHLRQHPEKEDEIAARLVNDALGQEDGNLALKAIGMLLDRVDGAVKRAAEADAPDAQMPEKTLIEQRADRIDAVNGNGSGEHNGN